ncbi:imidazole glycerol phosphate synthase subunit HisH [Gordonia araii NBRC 100433]|uniref:Imidazole glycerol phosphate synthase subunit HisH n=1 Tax=Gordonia araii NBRC 100433 TaxID=1073574 RepID=G7H2P6_9ACTN|nr:imidazole glycerol phosphate synthase subunit HisH [Gordonia araii]GAB10121.1 imidazole glycerol phosphate synthase subunit HisH [Gordonia araii NBRC 100433]
MSQPSVTILDYGSGNLRSAQRALEHVGAEVTVTSDRGAATECDGLLVPGVGAYAACMAGFTDVGGPQVVGRRLAGGRPVLGICVGMQIMFDAGVEFGVQTQGCGEWPGTVTRLDAPVLPHMGWNTVETPAESVLFDGIGSDERFYFVHSYAAQTWELGTEATSPIAAAKLTWATHGSRFLAAVENGALAATQFHPEKSGDVGLALLANWCRSLS